MKKNLNFGLAAFLISAALISCQKSNIIPVQFSAETTDLFFGIQTDNPVSTLENSKLASGNLINIGAASRRGFVWTGGTVNISKFKLEASRDGNPLEIQSSSLNDVDLFSLSQASSKVIIKSGSYANIELRVILVHAEADAPLPLVLKGVLTTDADTNWPVEFDFNEDAEIKACEGDITVDGAKSLSTKINIHLRELLTNITAQEMDAAIRKNGTIVITNTSNTGLYKKIKANLLTRSQSKFESRDN